MKPLLVAVGLLVAGTTLYMQAPAPAAEATDWIDRATGHRIVRLTDAAGGSTLYFHDNAFSPEGGTLMFNTPNGIAIVDVAGHNYVPGRGGVEPNVHITPDKQWVIFTGQFAAGERHV